MRKINLRALALDANQTGAVAAVCFVRPWARKPRS